VQGRDGVIVAEFRGQSRALAAELGSDGP